MAIIESIGHMRYDEVILEKNGGDCELVIKNATRGVVGGFLKNAGDGVTVFEVPPAGTGGDTITIDPNF